MRLAITGSNGIIGKILYNEYKKNKDYTVTGIDFNNSDINIDLLNENISGIFDNVDTVIHLAGNKKNTDSFDNILGPNIIMCERVFEECKKSTNVKKVVFASSNHTQIKGFKLEGVGNPTKKIDNTIMTQDDNYYPDSFYGVSKIFGEMLGKYYCTVENAFDFVAIRIGWVIDEKEAPNTDYYKCMKLTESDCIKTFNNALHTVPYKNNFVIMYGTSNNSYFLH